MFCERKPDVFITMTSQRRWYWALNYFRNKSAFCTGCTTCDISDGELASGRC